MPKIGQNFRISQRDFENEACVESSNRNKPSDS